MERSAVIGSAKSGGYKCSLIFVWPASCLVFYQYVWDKDRTIILSYMGCLAENLNTLLEVTHPILHKYNL